MFLVRFLLSVIQSEGPQESEQFGFTQLDSIQARGMRGRFSARLVVVVWRWRFG
jgi:hypothetical protein